VSALTQVLPLICVVMQANKLVRAVVVRAVVWYELLWMLHCVVVCCPGDPGDGHAFCSRCLVHPPASVFVGWALCLADISNAKRTHLLPGITHPPCDKWESPTSNSAPSTWTCGQQDGQVVLNELPHRVAPVTSPPQGTPDAAHPCYKEGCRPARGVAVHTRDARQVWRGCLDPH